MRGYGTCSVCKKYKYLHSSKCRTCYYKVDKCTKCGREIKIYVDGHCYLCYQDRQVLAKIVAMEKKFTPFNDYNNQLFSLYLSYIKRYRLYYAHTKATQGLIGILQREKIPIIKNWHDIYVLSDRYQIMLRPKKQQGHLFVKIGLMLSEMGLLPPREDDIDHILNNRLSHFNTPIMGDYVNALLKINTSKATIEKSLAILLSLENIAVRGFKINSLLLLNQFQILNFFDQQMELLNSSQQKRKIFLSVRQFYDWAITNKHVISNPVNCPEPARRPGQLLVCSEHQLLLIQNYIRNPKTNSESAFLLALIIFFGFSTAQLAQAQVIVQEDVLCIKINRRPLTKGKKYYNRKELLQLPHKPQWFFDLQKKFYKNWLEHYGKVKKTFPGTPLVLPNSNISNRYLHSGTVCGRVKKASFEAVGHEIPGKVLRQTCGHIYSTKADSSILSNLGWSEQFAFQYSWLPRTYVTKE